MQKILEKLNELVNIAEVRVNKANADKELNANKAIALDAKDKELKELEKSLDLREKKIKVCEDLAKAQLEVKQAVQRNEDERIRLERLKESQELDIKGRSEKIIADRSLLDQQKVKLQKQIDQLEQDKKSYKTKIIENLDKLGSK